MRSGCKSEPNTRSQFYSSRCVVGVQAVAPAQVSRRNRPVFADDAGSRLVAAERNVMKRPLGLMVAEVLPALAWALLVAMETRCVAGVQPEGTPAQVSRTKTSAAALVSPATRLVAEEMKVT